MCKPITLYYKNHQFSPTKQPLTSVTLNLYCVFPDKPEYMIYPAVGPAVGIGWAVPAGVPVTGPANGACGYPTQVTFNVPVPPDAATFISPAFT